MLQSAIRYVGSFCNGHGRASNCLGQHILQIKQARVATVVIELELGCGYVSCKRLNLLATQLLYCLTSMYSSRFGWLPACIDK